MNELFFGKVAFALYTLIVLSGGVLAVTSPSLVRAMVGLVVSLFGVAGYYLLLLADFVALMQILIYVGAVTVLIFFAVMLTGGGREGGGLASGGVIRAIAAFFIPTGTLIYFLVNHCPACLDRPKEVSAALLGAGLLGPYTLSFELISVVLLAAMAGAVLLAFEKRGAK